LMSQDLRRVARMIRINWIKPGAETTMLKDIPPLFFFHRFYTYALKSISHSLYYNPKILLKISIIPISYW